MRALSTSVGHHVLAAELIAVGRHDEALRELRQAVPGAPRAYYTLGGELLAAGQFDEAIVALQMFIREQGLLEEALPARRALGDALTHQHRFEEAAAQYRAILTMNPSLAQRSEAQGLLALALFQQRAFETTPSRRTAPISWTHRMTCPRSRT